MTFVHLPFSVWSVDLFFLPLHSCSRFMLQLCNKEELKVKSLVSRKIIQRSYIGHRSTWFPLLSACRLVKFDTCNLPCVYALLRLISIARYAFKSPRICFRGTKHEIYREQVAYLHSILCAGPAKCD